ncbi:MAG TPA: sensor histidine kinase [Ktedonobacterales bacterium]|nr:sensor histidine kinase [Ktedonobacterales bacterium]
MREVGPLAARAASASAPSRRATALWWLLWVLWVPLSVPLVVDLFRSHASAWRIAISVPGALACFALYGWMTWRSARYLASAAPRPLPVADRGWWPLTAMLALAVGLTLLDGPAWGNLFIYTATAAAGWLPLRQTAAVIAGISLFTLLGLGARGRFDLALAALPFILIPGVIVAVMMRAATTNQELRAAREAMAGFTAVTEERLRIARDLHDLLGHSLSLIALKSELAGRLVTAAPERAAAEIHDIEGVARTALHEVRETVAGYRQPTLAGELRAARDLLAAAGIAGTLPSAEAAGSLLVVVEAALAWAVREGVTNVMRHSRARHCVIALRRAADAVTVEIRNDDGGPARPHAAALTTPAAGMRPGGGLRGLDERVRALGGSLESGPLPGGGFRLAVTVPCAPTSAATPPPGVIDAPRVAPAPPALSGATPAEAPTPGAEA